MPVLLYLFKYFSRSQYLFLHFDFLWYSPFISVTQSSFPWLSLPYLSCSGLTENTYVIFAANMPTGEKSTDCPDRQTSEGKPGRAVLALSEDKVKCVTSAATFFQGEPHSAGLFQRHFVRILLFVCGENQTFHGVFVFQWDGFTNILASPPQPRPATPAWPHMALTTEYLSPRLPTEDTHMPFSFSG